MREVHRLGGGGRLVEERRIRDIEPGQVDDRGLEVEQRLEASLGDFRLVRSVLSVPAWVLHDVPENHTRHQRIAVPHTEIRAEHAVLGGDVSEPADQFRFGERLGKLERSA